MSGENLPMQPQAEASTPTAECRGCTAPSWSCGLNSMSGGQGALPVLGRSRRGKQRHGLEIVACRVSEMLLFQARFRGLGANYSFMVSRLISAGGFDVCPFPLSVLQALVEDFTAPRLVCCVRPPLYKMELLLVNILF